MNQNLMKSLDFSLPIQNQCKQTILLLLSSAFHHHHHHSFHSC